MSQEYTFTARIEDGRLKVGLRALETMRGALTGWRACPVTVTIEKQHATRSLDQNALYWVGYVQPIAEHTGYTPLEMHDYLKGRFLPRKHLLIQDAAGVVVDETDLAALTTTTLNKIQFGEYLSEIEAFALTLDVRVGNQEAA